MLFLIANPQFQIPNLLPQANPALFLNKLLV